MEKRRRPRKKTSLPARFGADRPERLGLVTDVTAGGVYLATNAVLSRGSVVQLQVKVPSGDQVLLQGRVMRSKRVASALAMIATGGMGVKLDNPPPGWRSSLALPEDP